MEDLLDALEAFYPTLEDIRIQLKELNKLLRDLLIVKDSEPPMVDSDLLSSVNKNLEEVLSESSSRLAANESVGRGHRETDRGRIAQPSLIR